MQNVSTDWWPYPAALGKYLPSISKGVPQVALINHTGSVLVHDCERLQAEDTYRGYQRRQYSSIQQE